jgi:coenzyme F420-reducing hydrogenase beta subunit
MLNFSEIKCVGCTACASVCPKNIIDMKRNSEGFQYPLVESTSECIECGLCEEVCPVLNFRQETKFQQKGLIAQIKDEKIRHDSTSGGMFSAIALSVLDNNGIVYGAAFNESFEVCHMGISDKEDLWKIRGSKSCLPIAILCFIKNLIFSSF